MKIIVTTLIATFIMFGSALTNSNSATQQVSPINYQADEPPATGNDGEDLSERGLMCRLFGYFC